LAGNISSELKKMSPKDFVDVVHASTSEFPLLSRLATIVFIGFLMFHGLDTAG
jgi:hypothetical protein